MPLNFYTKADLLELTNTREGEEKIGQSLQVCSENWKKDIENSTANIVILGISEDIGVKANLGRPGTVKAFEAFIRSFANVQINQFFPIDSVVLLGEYIPTELISSSKYLKADKSKDLLELRNHVSRIDKDVRSIVQTIVASGKTPLIIGGGHNNAYPIIAGTSLAKESAIQVINCDPHCDFRKIEGRHSGNGFRYAFEEGFLDKYSIVGLHEGYNNQESLDALNQHSSQIFYGLFEDAFVRVKESWIEQIKEGLSFLDETKPTGIELDMDSIAHMPVSAMTSSGIRLEEARQYIHLASETHNIGYIHICEAAPLLHPDGKTIAGKALSYLVQDVIKAIYAK